MHELVARRTLPALALVAACGARTDLPCFDEPCPDPDDVAVARANECDAADFEAPACTGSGRIATLEDDCIDDGGNGQSGDVLEIFCVAGIARFCLSHETCPWRSELTTPDDLTCSNGGLSSVYMANAIRGCPGWEGHSLFCCSEDGRVGLR